jgi:hypothetical protein
MISDASTDIRSSDAGIYGTFYGGCRHAAMVQEVPIPFVLRMERSQLIWRGVCVPLLHKECQGMAGANPPKGFIQEH